MIDSSVHSPGLLVSAADALATAAHCTLLDARTGAAYRAGHLHGARPAYTDVTLARVDPRADLAIGGRHPLPSTVAWQYECERWGLRRSGRIVVYDDASGSNAAARAWWMLRASGYTNSVVLDGGLSAAQAIGWAVERGEASAFVPWGGDAQVRAWQWPMADAPTVNRVRQLATWRVIDVRAPERWRGEVETRDPVAGRIPGSVNIPWTLNLRADGTFRSPEELRALYRERLGDVEPQRIVVHCGSGVTACHTLLALNVAGMHGAALYVGSWSEWCRGDWPIARGAGD